MENTLSDRVTTLILAGGKSTRMGQDKALIVVNGNPLLKKLCLMARDYTARVYVVTPWGDRYQSLLPSGCQIIDENPAHQGPLVGFAQGLVHVSTPWCFLLACDLPYLNATEIQQWFSYLFQTDSTAIAFLARHPKGWEPLCGFYRSQALSSLQSFMAKGGRSFQQWLTQQDVQELPISDPQCLFNCNTPTDLASLSFG